MSEEIIIANQSNLAKFRAALQESGLLSLHILSDFDKTLLSPFCNGKKIASLISVLRDNNFLTPDYPEKAKALFTKFHPIEIDQHIPLADKKKAMEQWWREHFALLISSGLTKNEIWRACELQELALRQGADNFLDFLQVKNIPLVIISASGIGFDSIKMFLENRSKMSNNIFIISNQFIWDDKGKAVGAKEPIIHSFNKDGTLLANYDFFHKIKSRKNVLLLGDSLGDLGMITGFDYDNLLTVGFFEESPEVLDEYKKYYDILLLNNGSFDFINKLLTKF